MERNFICNGKVTFPNGSASSTQYTFMSRDDGTMLNVTDPSDLLFDYGDDVLVTVAKDTKTGAIETGPSAGTEESAAQGAAVDPTPSAVE